MGNRFPWVFSHGFDVVTHSGSFDFKPLSDGSSKAVSPTVTLCAVSGGQVAVTTDVDGEFELEFGWLERPSARSSCTFAVCFSVVFEEYVSKLFWGW